MTIQAIVPGKLVVVGGHSRHVGKTCIMEAVLRATPELEWHAYKISAHRHLMRDDVIAPRRGGQPARYLAAGAVTGHLLHAPDGNLAQAVLPLADMRRDGHNLLVESNRIVAHLHPDLLVFVVDPLNGDWKSSSAACLQLADAVVFSQDGPYPRELLPLNRMLPAFRFVSWDRSPIGFDQWLRQHLRLAEVTSPEALVVGCRGRHAGSPANGGAGAANRPGRPRPSTTLSQFGSASAGPSR